MRSWMRALLVIVLVGVTALLAFAGWSWLLAGIGIFVAALLFWDWRELR